MKQTAVEWLHEQLTSTWYDGKSSKEVLEIAKYKERDQIIQAHGKQLKKTQTAGNYEYWKTGEQYYNETYGKK
jgi:hypothetical protein